MWIHPPFLWSFLEEASTRRTLSSAWAASQLTARWRSSCSSQPQFLFGQDPLDVCPEFAPEHVDIIPTSIYLFEQAVQ